MDGDLIRLIQSLFPQPDVWQPPTDVYRTREGWLVKFDLAGVRPEDVQLRVSGAQLTVSGTRRDWCREEGCSYYLMEITYSHFERSIQLSGDLGRAHITTEHRYGLLLVRIRMEAD
jgi:HSP20 family protein